MNDASKSQQASVQALHLLTTQAVLADLISGRAVTTDKAGSFTLPTDGARAVLDWYRRNPQKWPANLSASDCEAIVDSVISKPPTLTSTSVAPASGGATLRLVRVRAHRFAGLHAYGAGVGSPLDFEFEPMKAITLFEGWNGSGKTSIANAIIWCLTGQLLRPQRQPEEGAEEFSFSIERDGAEASEHLIAPVTPLPNGVVWKPDASLRHIPIDTWVEVTLVQEDGTLLPPIRRSLSRKPSGKIDEQPPNLTVLGLDDLAVRLGTTMPGMLPFLQVGTASDIGHAAAKLTGLADFVNLAKHATKAEARISKEMVRDLNTQLGEINETFQQHLDDLAAEMAAYPTMKPSAPMPLFDDAKGRASAQALKQHFAIVKANGLAGAKAVLGDSFDADNQQHRDDLEASIGPAIEKLRNSNSLPSIERLSALKLEAGEAEAVRKLLDSLMTQAITLAELAGNPSLSRRVQLYARVASWQLENGETDADVCSVCRGPLKGVVDPDTGQLVHQHIESVRADSETVSKTIAQWAAHWTGHLARDLPLALRQELDKDLPASPADLVRAGIVDELFATDEFSGTLAALRPATSELVKDELGQLPPFVDPTFSVYPPSITNAAPRLVTMRRRVERALSFVDWMAAHRTALVDTLKSVRSGAEHSKDRALGPKLIQLQDIVKGVVPVSKAIGIAQRIDDALAKRDLKKARIAACTAAANALAAIQPIGALAQAQVDHLQAQLQGRSAYWRDRIYQNQTTLSPKPQQVGMTGKGVIEIAVGGEGVRAPAQHVSNASALRASLLGFYLAFREHVLKVRGGLSLLILDDPQDLLDSDNRQRLARAIQTLAKDGAQILATSHDRSFARLVVAEARPDDLIQHRSIHPVNAGRNTLETSLAVEELDRKRAAFLKNVDSAPDAQDYASAARVFLEARLGDLFDDPAYPAYSAPSAAPTLIDLYARFQGLVSTKSNELFRSHVLHRLASDPGMIPLAEARRVLNESHHNKASLSYMDVKKVDGDLVRLRKTMEQVHEEFRRFRWREPLSAEQLKGNVVPLVPITAPKFDVPVYQDIAAFTRDLPSGADTGAVDETLSSTWFDDKALFYVRHNTMGFSVPPGSVVIVERTPSACKDHNLVVARKGNHTYARRLLRPKNGDGLTLAAEPPDPREGRPTLRFDDHQIDLHRVVGVMFSNLPPPPERDEASEVQSLPMLARVEVAYRVREDSAVPLALPNQTILGGGKVTASDLDAMEGELVAVTLDNGGSIFKRVGERLPGSLSYVRQFEAIGGLGKSTVISTEQVEGGPDVPVMLYARRVLGVIYDF